MKPGQSSSTVVVDPSNRESDRHATRLRRTTLLFIERRRLGVTADLRRLRLPRKRLEDLCLAAALCRSQRRCIITMEESESTADRVLMANLDAQLAELEGSRTKIERWLPPNVRADAEAKAQARFRAIAGNIRDELGSEGLLPELIAPSPEPPVPAPTRCTATTRKGSRCKNRARETGLCAVHARARAAVAADSEVARPAVDVPDPVVAGTPAAATAVLNRLPVPHPGKLRLDPRRIDARLAWPSAGSVAVAAAAVLIWSGLSTGDNGAPGAGMVVDSDTDRIAALPADHSSFGAARGDTHDDGARSHAAKSHRGGLRSSGRGEPGVSRRGEPDSALVVAGGPGPDSEGDGSTPASPAAPAPSSPSPEPAPAPSPQPSPEPAPAPSPDPDPPPQAGTGGAAENPSPLGVVSDTLAQLPQVGGLLGN